MAELLLLGTGSSLNDGTREPTMLALRGRTSTILIDCGSNPIRQLQRLGVPIASVERIILTHSHPDHNSGFGLLVTMLWLSGRHHPIPVYGPADAVDTTRRLFAQWDTSDWRDLPALEWHEVELRIGAPIFTNADFELTAAPGLHHVPVIGVRARDVLGGGVMAYSSDGEPTPGIQALAQDADLVVHEATMPADGNGHSSAVSAARLARAAGAKRLLLVHVSAGADELEKQRQAAEQVLGREVMVGYDLDCHKF
jgi:ribonuclease Z